MTHPRPKRQELTPGERADMLGKLGYTLRRTDTLGVYLLTRPDGSRTYRIDANAGHCSCPSTAWHGCKHRLFVDWFWQYDRARADLESAYARDLLVHEHEDSFHATAIMLMRITGLDMWDEMRSWQRRVQGRTVVAGRAVAA